MTKARLICSILVGIFLFASPLMAQDPGNRDTVRVAKVTSNAGLDVGVPVSCYNDENVGGYSLGFEWDSFDVTIDSISYIGSRLPASTVKLFTPDNPNRRALIGMLDISGSNPLSSGSGLIFTIWYSVGGSAPDQYVSIDSTFVPPAGIFKLAPTTGGTIVPEFFKGEIKIGNPPPPPVIVLSSSSFTFNGDVGGGNPPSQLQNITNGGGSTLNWTATKDSAWLVINPTSGTAPTTMVVSVNTAGKGAGTYKDTVRVSAAGATNSPQKFLVTLNLTIPPPIIKLTPNNFYFQSLQGDVNPPGQIMNITNIGLGTLSWTATETSTWFSLSSYSGTAPSPVTIDVDNTGLTPGIYVDSAKISDPNATNDPQYAKVTFEIFSAFPVIVHEPETVLVAGSATVDPYTRPFYIKNNGGGIMNWHVTKTKPWMTFDIDTGSAVQGSPGVVMLSFNRNLVDFGQNRDTITITSTNATNSPQKVKTIFWKMEVPQSMSLSTNSLDFTDYECGSCAGVVTRNFTVNAAIASPILRWTLDYDAAWMTVTPTSANHTAQVTVAVSNAGLTPGVYVDTIVVNSDVCINPPQIVVVTFNVLTTPPNPFIDLNRDSLFYLFKYTQLGSSSQNVTICNAPGGCIDWQATPDVPWLTAIPATGTTKATMSVRADAVGLSLGLHEGNVLFTSSVAGNSPVILPVDLWIYTFGDANCDGLIDVSDVVYIIEYIFQAGPAPCPVFWTGDVDCDHFTDIADCVWLIDWIFNGGPSPCLY